LAEVRAGHGVAVHEQGLGVAKPFCCALSFACATGPVMHKRCVGARLQAVGRGWCGRQVCGSAAGCGARVLQQALRLHCVCRSKVSECVHALCAWLPRCSCGCVLQRLCALNFLHACRCVAARSQRFPSHGLVGQVPGPSSLCARTHRGSLSQQCRTRSLETGARTQ
jgi:hypothetical protein